MNCFYCKSENISLKKYNETFDFNLCNICGASEYFDRKYGSPNQYMILLDDKHCILYKNKDERVIFGIYKKGFTYKDFGSFKSFIPRKILNKFPITMDDVNRYLILK